MTTNNPPLSAGTLRTASIIILIFAALALLFGATMMRAGGNASATAKQLQERGLPGTVVDARANEVRADDGEWHAMRVELTFTAAHGQEHALETTHFPGYYPPTDSAGGWVQDFPTKDQIVGQTVRYQLGDRAAVELESELPALMEAGWTFPQYLGLGVLILGAGAAVGGVAVLFRALARLRAGEA